MDLFFSHTVFVLSQENQTFILNVNFQTEFFFRHQTNKHFEIFSV